MFWGCKLNSEKPFVLNRKQTISYNISKAVLVKGNASENILLKLNIGKDSFIIASLTEKNTEKSLNHFISLEENQAEEYSLSLSGNNLKEVEVHVTGIFEIEDQEDENLSLNEEVLIDEKHKDQNNETSIKEINNSNYNDYSDEEVDLLNKPDHKEIHIKDLLKKHPRHNNDAKASIKLEKMQKHQINSGNHKKGNNNSNKNNNKKFNKQ